MTVALLYVAIAYCLFWMGALFIFAGDTRAHMERRIRDAKLARPHARPALEAAPAPATVARARPLTARRFDLFHGMSDEQVDRILAVSRRREARAGELLAPCEDAVFLLLRGDVELSTSGAFDEGQQHLRVEAARPGEGLGWMSLVPSSPWQPSARARGEAIVLEFPRDALNALLAAAPELAAAVHSNLTARAAAELHGIWLTHRRRAMDGAGGRRAPAA